MLVVIEKFALTITFQTDICTQILDIYSRIPENEKCASDTADSTSDSKKKTAILESAPMISIKNLAFQEPSKEHPCETLGNQLRTTSGTSKLCHRDSNIQYVTPSKVTFIPLFFIYFFYNFLVLFIISHYSAANLNSVHLLKPCF